LSKSDGRVLDQSQIVSLSAEQDGERVVGGPDGFRLSFRGFISTDLLFEPQVGGNRIANRAGHEGCAGIIEVDQVRTARRIRPPTANFPLQAGGQRSSHRLSSSMPRSQ
jgi:hypothetical protein